MSADRNRHVKDYINYVRSKTGAFRKLCKWVFLASVVGGIVGSVGSLFGHTLTFVNNFRAQHPQILLGLPFAGLLIVFLYRFFKNTNDTGTNMVISSIHSSTEIPFKMAPLIFVSTALTHLCGGSAGREGAALQLGASISNQLGKFLKLSEQERKVIVMCGMSAGFSALFGTPMAAAIFALEVSTIGIMQYYALVPCVTAAMTAHFTAKFFQMTPETFTVSLIPGMDMVMFLKMVLFAVLAGGMSILFCMILHTAEHLYKQHLKNAYVRIFVSGCLIILLAIMAGGEYLGPGMSMIEHIFHTGEIKIYSFLLKMVFTALTLGAGFKGGEIVPSFCIGAALGCAASSFFGLPPALAAACGMTGLFCGVTNSPITSLLIAFELFGFEGMPYYLVTVAVSYMISGYFGLYHAQKIIYSKTSYEKL